MILQSSLLLVYRPNADEIHIVLKPQCRRDALMTKEQPIRVPFGRSRNPMTSGPTVACGGTCTDTNDWLSPRRSGEVAPLRRSALVLTAFGGILCRRPFSSSVSP